VILAIHGGMAHGGDYVTPALYFRQHGIATVAYDLCGHQDARRVDIPGFATFLDDSLLFLQWVKQQYPGLPVYVMGHSMGALIATHLGSATSPARPRSRLHPVVAVLRERDQSIAGAAGAGRRAGSAGAAHEGAAGIADASAHARQRHHRTPSRR
jgi:pimeloyl-ACP methyl ester carboxylesterase